MKIYEEQRIILDNNFLIARGKLEEKIKGLDSKIPEQDEIINKQVKIYMNELRNCFVDIKTEEKLDKIMYHYFTASENLLIIFPIKSSEDNAYKQIFDKEKGLFYIETEE